uniref:Uncharacterized protein n=1 Tax=Rhizophora mucronata TaxID=61149 RepID=A0A2P2Q1K5_RHIMU
MCIEPEIHFLTCQTRDGHILEIKHQVTSLR